ncbi:hypothetical protein ACJMK2_043143 [Sinanodonta woodiana]|uniref:BTB domain-containing protein n=1 Tax=Sinanodonta woodiana TaxID=1069815 RepID=A0ABD3VXR1_SINWO
MIRRAIKQRRSALEVVSKGYKDEFIRKRLLQKAFHGNEKGVKILNKLSETLHSGMEVMWRQHFMCDVELVTCNKKLLAHRLVLATCSDYFYDLFVENQETSFSIEINELSGDVLSVILEALYTGRVRVEAANVDDLLAAATLLGMYFIQEACEEFLMEHVEKDNCLQLLDTAFKSNLCKLAEKALGVAAKHFHSISKKAIFLHLPVEQLMALLKRDDIDGSSELEFFQRMRSWIEEDKQNRLRYAPELMAAVRLPLLNPSVVVDHVESIEYLMEIPECQQLVKEALHYHCLPARQCLLQSSRTVPRARAVPSLIIIGGAPRIKTDPVRDEILKYNFTDCRWELLTRLPEPRHHHGVAVLNGFLYVAGGEPQNEHGNPVNTMHRFDPRNNTWLLVASMKHARQSFQLGILNGMIYAIGGRINATDSLASVERYNPSVNTWEDVTPLNSPRRCVAVGCLSGRLYAVGGSGGKSVSSRVERYNPIENKWDLLNPINIPRFFGHLFSVHSNLFLVGGATVDADGNVVCVDSIEKFCLSTGQWSVICTMQNPRSEFGGCVMNDRIYIFGGYNWNLNQRSCNVEYFDTDTKTWSSLTRLEQPLTGLAACTITLYHKGPTE